MFTYNFSLLFFFWTLMQFTSFQILTLNSLTDLKMNNFTLIIITFILFSMAGIPPFLGFFAKMLILVLLLNSNFFSLFIFFFVFLFLALYFYLQNLRFLYSSSKSSFNNFFIQTAVVSHIFLFTGCFCSIFFLMSFFFVDDLFLLFWWILL